MYGGPILTRKRRCCMCNKVMSQVQMARAAAVAVASCPDARDCPMCDYVATARSSLIIHMRKHTGERPYRCHLCPAAFAKSSDRSRHFRTHQLHKPFNCGSCGKSFAQRRRDLQSWTCRHASTPRLAPDTSASCVTLPRRSLTTYVLTCTHITLGRPASMPSLDNIGSAWSAATSRRKETLGLTSDLAILQLSTLAGSPAGHREQQVARELCRFPETCDALVLLMPYLGTSSLLLAGLEYIYYEALELYCLYQIL
ncbi:uncharacterized protein [Dermacentor albipictus]|uniref:uncharacterized protein isoform X5 n=1 Tax=Dermacentor albipictus TaxID=60249 RepID=UPI0031FBC17C